MRRIFLSEEQLKYITEVRYINTSTNNKDNNIIKQEPIKNDDKIRVYHGCSLNTAIDILLNGTSGKAYHPRVYSYENGMNPLGIFVSTDFKQSIRFTSGEKVACILEFTVKASDLESPVWNNSNTYFYRGDDTQPFQNRNERDKQKLKYHNDALNLKNYHYYDPDGKKKVIDYDHIRNSDKTEMAKNIFNNDEHQALFMGDINPNMIKRIWVHERGNRLLPLKRHVFYEWYIKPILNDELKKEKIYNNMNLSLPQKYTKTKDLKEFPYNAGLNRRNKLFKPNDDTDKTLLIKKLYYQNRDWISNYNDLFNIKYIKDLLSNNPINIDNVNDLLWPRQIIQLYGKDYFDKNFNKFGQ